MTIDRDMLLRWRIPETERKFSPRDTILYALSVGLGADPVDPRQLRFVYEPGLLALPSMAVVVGYAGSWMRDPNTGINYRKVVQVEQGFELHRALSPEGDFRIRPRVTAVTDRGREKGALVTVECEVKDLASDQPVCITRSTNLCRGDGGFGGPTGPVPVPPSMPEREPDHVCALPTLPQAALLYRLNGDLNPLHADPAVARNAGFDRPILHGRCTFAVAGHALLRTLCDYEPERFRGMSARFSSPVLPGETVLTEIWREPQGAKFRCRVSGREAVVLDNGLAEFAS